MRVLLKLLSGGEISPPLKNVRSTRKAGTTRTVELLLAFFSGAGRCVKVSAPSFPMLAITISVELICVPAYDDCYLTVNLRSDLKSVLLHETGSRKYDSFRDCVSC